MGCGGGLRVAAALVVLVTGCNSILGIPDPFLDTMADAPPGTTFDAPIGPTVDARPDAPVADAAVVDARRTGDGPPPILVNVIDTEHAEGGPTSGASAATIAATRLADLASLPVEPTAPGVYNVFEAPLGERVLHDRSASGSFEPLAAISAAREIDLGVDLQGRNAAPAAGDVTYVLTLNSLVAFAAATDELTLEVPNRARSERVNGVPEGSTMLNGFRVNAGTRLPLSASAGDVLSVCQRRNGVIIRSLTLPSFDAGPGDNAVGGALAGTAGRVVDLFFVGDDFYANTPATTPARDAAVRTAVVQIAARNATAFWPIAGEGARRDGLLLERTLSPPNMQLPVDDTIRNPFSSTWELVVIAKEEVAATIGGTPFKAYVMVQRLLSDVEDDPGQEAGKLRVRIGPVSAPRIDDKDLLGATITVDTTTPRLTWGDAFVPENLCPTSRHVVQATDIASMQGSKRIVLDGAARSLRVPPGVLSSGHSYVIRITAMCGGPSGDAAPFRMTYPHGAADVLSGLITVQ